MTIKKDGISLRGFDAVLKPPAKATSPCGVSGFCVNADNVSISGFTVRNFRDNGIIAIGARNPKFMTNRAINNGEYGIAAFSSTGTQIIGNLTSGSDDAGIYVGDSPHADATVAGNETYDNLLGILCAMPATARSPVTRYVTTAWGCCSSPMHRVLRVYSTCVVTR